MRTLPLPLLIAAPIALTACGTGNPLQVARSACPAVAVLDYAGDTTLFSPATSRNADAIDMTATITNLRSDCFEADGRIVTQATYDIVALRTDANAARTVTLPVFSAVMRAGDRLLAKEVAGVTLTFAPGELRAQSRASARADIAEVAATLPDAINREIDKRRKPGDPDAALDPLARPEVREAVREASFELIVGFNLDEAALAYNVAK